MKKGWKKGLKKVFSVFCVFFYYKSFKMAFVRLILLFSLPHITNPPSFPSLINLVVSENDINIYNDDDDDILKNFFFRPVIWFRFEMREKIFGEREREKERGEEEEGVGRTDGKKRKVKGGSNRIQLLSIII